MIFIKLNKIVIAVIFSLISTSVIAEKMTKNLTDSIKQQNSSPSYILPNNKNTFLRNSVLSTNLLLVEIGTKDLTEEDRKLFDLPGVKIKSYSTKYNRISLAVTDNSQLRKIEAITKVVIMKRNYGSHTRVGKVTSRALATMRTPTSLTLSGKGQKIGIISDSFARTTLVTGKAADLPSGNTSPIILTETLNQLSGDIPDTIDLRNDNATGASDEGAAMAELVYDIANDVQIAFNTAGDSQVSFAEAITDLCTVAKSNIVVDDVGFFAEPIYQAGIIAQAATECVKSGVVYFSAAGNNANFGFRQQFEDVNPNHDDITTPPTGDDFHDWGDGNKFLKIELPASSIYGPAVVAIILQWNQPFESINAVKGSEIDLNLHVYGAADLNSTPLTLYLDYIGGTNVQAIKNGVVTPSGDAIENLIILNNQSTPRTMYLAIDNLRGSLTTIPQDSSTPLEFSIMFFGEVTIDKIVDSTSNYGGPTIFGHPAAEGVIAVAAVPWYDTNTSEYQATTTPTANIDPESFTSRGGELTVFFDKNGDFKPTTKYVPDISAVDQNNTTFFIADLVNNIGIPGEPDNFPNFAGTSAAAPNAAAIAALALEINPKLTPAEIESLLESTAQDVSGFRASEGVDDVTGAGLIDINAFLSKVRGDSKPAEDKPSGSSSSGGCSLSPMADFDPVLPLIVLLLSLVVYFRKYKKKVNI